MSHGLFFFAVNDRGRLHVDYVRTATREAIDGVHFRAPELKADELYKIMFDHFEQVAKETGKPIKGFSGEFAFDNFNAVRKGDVTAIKYLLSTVGKKRGYIERKEVDASLAGHLDFGWIDDTSGTDSD